MGKLKPNNVCIIQKNSLYWKKHENCICKGENNMIGNRGKRLSQYLGDYVVFDLETTGVRQGVDRIVEISAIRVRSHQPAGEYTTLADP